MPKRGMEPIRRAALIDATIAEIGDRGSLDITVGQIAKRAGVSSGLAHHYFGGKDDILLAAMRHILRSYSAEVAKGLKAAPSPWGRVEAIVAASFAPPNFRPDVVSAWLNFYVLALASTEARRLHRVYAGRLRSNLRHAIRATLADRATQHADRATPLADRATQLADRATQLIDGAYLGHGLAPGGPDGGTAMKDVLSMIETGLKD